MNSGLTQFGRDRLQGTHPNWPYGQYQAQSRNFTMPPRYHYLPPPSPALQYFQGDSVKQPNFQGRGGSGEQRQRYFFDGESGGGGGGRDPQQRNYHGEQHSGQGPQRNYGGEEQIWGEEQNISRGGGGEQHSRGGGGDQHSCGGGHKSQNKKKKKSQEQDDDNSNAQPTKALSR
eukprot:CAMPEP_0194317178 /NCGR_PEP_ID=MMETSP0171-20130528/13922_1 /TAXON_ID=218684 /ORGANISM="Corethron pennatum, Strain L29A3" /LENGTH=173 /DNA_ID=CAMNT_0039073677 /DNA_START=1231 /DNA_END=1752 /DNA_ORIENTATION=+